MNEDSGREFIADQDADKHVAAGLISPTSSMSSPWFFHHYHNRTYDVTGVHEDWKPDFINIKVPFSGTADMQASVGAALGHTVNRQTTCRFGVRVTGVTPEWHHATEETSVRIDFEYCVAGAGPSLPTLEGILFFGVVQGKIPAECSIKSLEAQA